ncbi:MAG: NAD-dependent deacylase [Anaerolineae bacterium]|nr:NAD-dependent deacylase [Anaerolineae bacterium]
MDDALRQAVTLLNNATRVVVLTGAGVSKESGIPTFRDAQTGLWARYDPTQLATPEAFRRDPKLVWDFYEFRREVMRPAQPNPAHVALAQLERRVPQFTLITQNVDDLHERAGSIHIIRLHGQIHRNKCFNACQGEPTYIDVAALARDRAAGPPTCPHCGAFVRPDIVWFGEGLPAQALSAAQSASAAAEVMLIVGTSGMVTPAADLPYIARQSGAALIEFNPLPSAITPIVNLHFAEAAGVALPRLITALEERRGE